MNPSRRGLSLVELLVVLGILGLLVALTLPGLQRTRQAAMRARCQSNLKNQAFAVFAYEQHRGLLPPGAVMGPYESIGVPEGVSHGLWALLIPFLDQPSLALDYRWNVNFDHADNEPVAKAVMPTLLCPAVTGDGTVGIDVDDMGMPTRRLGAAHYGPVSPSSILADLGLSEPGIDFSGALPVNGSARLADVKDGASCTLLLVERGVAAAWASPDVVAAVTQAYAGGGGMPGGAVHPEGLPVAFCDGSIRVIPWHVSKRTFAALATRNGGEAISIDW